MRARLALKSVQVFGESYDCRLVYPSGERLLHEGVSRTSRPDMGDRGFTPVPFARVEMAHASCVQKRILPSFQNGISNRSTNSFKNGW
jgi:hypothetical protein